MIKLRKKIMGCLIGAMFMFASTNCVGGFVATSGPVSAPVPVPRPYIGYMPGPYLRPRPIPIARPLRPMIPHFPALPGPGPVSPGAMRPHALVPQSPGPRNPILPSRPGGF